MEDNNQVNVQNDVQPTIQAAPVVEEQQDPRLIHAEIIGELRKEKIGKPIMVIELFLLFGIVFAALPFINNMLSDENSALYRLLHPDAVIDTPISQNNPGDEVNEFLDGSKLQLLSGESKIKYKNIILKDISLSEGTLTCTMYSYTGVVNLDDGEYYMVVSSSSGNELASIKLIGTIDNVEKQYKLRVAGIKFNNSLAYQGKIVEMTSDDYPAFQLTGVTEQGYASMICTRDDRTITYGFKNDFLISISDVDNVLHSAYSDDEYINQLTLSRKKAENLGTSVATVEENENGYIFTANIVLDGGYTIPTTVVDNNYYSLNTKVNRIAYAQKSKGFDCK